MKNSKMIKKVTALLLAFVMTVATLLVNYAVNALSGEPEDEKIPVIWDFTTNATWKQAVDLKDLPFDMPGLISNYGSQQWVSDQNLGLMTVGGGVFFVKVCDNSPLRITYSGDTAPKIGVSSTVNDGYTTLDITPVIDNGVNVLSIEGIGEGNCYVQYTFPENSGWSDYASHQLKTFSFKEWHAIQKPWFFTDNSEWKQAVDLKDLPFDMPGLVGNYGSQQWVSHDNLGLMTVGGGVFTVKAALNSPLKITYKLKSGIDNIPLPRVHVASSQSGPFEELTFTPELNGDIYTISIDGIGDDNCYIQYTFPENSGWDGYTLHSLRSFEFEQWDDSQAPVLAPPKKLNAPECDTKLCFDKANDKVYWDLRECFKTTSNLFYGGTDGGVFPATMPYEGGKASFTMRVGNNSPVVICYKQNDTKKTPKYYASNDNEEWIELQPYATATDSSGNTWDYIQGIGENNILFNFEFPQSAEDFNSGRSWILLLQCLIFDTRNGAHVAVESNNGYNEADGTMTIDFVSKSWNQSFNLKKYTDIVGTQGSFVSDRQGFMRLDIDWGTLCVNTENPGWLQFVMAENSSVTLDVGIRSEECRPYFYVSSDKKKWKAIEADSFIFVGEDDDTIEEDYIHRYVFNGIGKSNIYFKFDFGVKMGDSYAKLALRNIKFTKNLQYKPPEEPTCTNAIYFDAQKDQAYYDFRGCNEVTDNMFWGGKEGGVFPCTMPSTGGQPGVIVKVAANSPIIVRYNDLGMGSKPIYGVSKDKLNWEIIEEDWGTKDEKGQNVDVINTVGSDNLYFRFEFPQTQKNMDAAQGWLLVLQSIYFNKPSADKEIAEEVIAKEIDPSIPSYDTKKPVSDKDPLKDVEKTNLKWLWISITGLVCCGAAGTVFALLKRKAKKIDAE